jgi:hypothetical protein
VNERDEALRERPEGFGRQRPAAERQVRAGELFTQKRRYAPGAAGCRVGLDAPTVLDQLLIEQQPEQPGELGGVLQQRVERDGDGHLGHAGIDRPRRDRRSAIRHIERSDERALHLSDQHRARGDALQRRLATLIAARDVEERDASRPFAMVDPNDGEPMLSGPCSPRKIQLPT